MNDAPEVTVSVSFGEARKGAEGMIDAAMGGKRDPREVHYSASADGADVCRDCAHWEGDDQDTEASCTEVGGQVEAGATCDLFKAAAGDSPPTGHEEPHGAPEKHAPPFGGDDTKEHE